MVFFVTIFHGPDEGYRVLKELTMFCIVSQFTALPEAVSVSGLSINGPPSTGVVVVG